MIPCQIRTQKDADEVASQMLRAIIRSQDPINLVIPIEPCAKGRPRFTKTGHAYTDAKTRAAETELGYLVKEQVKSPPFCPTTPLRLSVTFFVKRPKHTKNKFPIVRPDLDNYIKLLEDACNGILWDDDSQIISIEAHKRYGEPRIELTLDEARDY